MLRFISEELVYIDFTIAFLSVFTAIRLNSLGIFESNLAVRLCTKMTIYSDLPFPLTPALESHFEVYL